MLNIIMLSVIMLSVTMLSVIFLSVIFLSVIMLSVMASFLQETSEISPLFWLRPDLSLILSFVFALCVRI